MYSGHCVYVCVYIVCMTLAFIHRCDIGDKGEMHFSILHLLKCTCRAIRLAEPFT